MSNETRKLPTRPGWWWADITDITGLVSRDVVEVYRAEGHGDRLFIYDKNSIDRADHEWLAPIPGPEVCAALAEYGVSLSMADSRMGGMSSPEIAGHFRASDALDTAIRAERDGAA